MGRPSQVVMLLLYIPLEQCLYISAPICSRKGSISLVLATERGTHPFLEEANEEMPAACKGFKIGHITCQSVSVAAGIFCVGEGNEPNFET